MATAWATTSSIRDHIGAISPTTGKALEWNPGSNSFEGNKAMLVHTAWPDHRRRRHHPGRLQRRPHRGLRLRELRHPRANETTITAPIEGRVVAPDVPTTISGTATATSGIRRVQLEIIDSATRRYLQDDLVTWGAANTINANLTSPNATSSTWSLPVTITGNRKMQVLARTVAVNGSNDPTKATKKFETFGLSDQTPATAISLPASGVVPTTTFTVTGTATDDVGINSLTFTLRDAQNRYLQDDGTASATYNAFRGTPDVVGATSATWRIEVTVPYEGEWTMQATAVDTAGQPDIRSADRTWLVSANAIAPSVSITSPTAMQPPTAVAPLAVTPGSPMTFTGSATDDASVRLVEIRLTNNSTRETLAADGSWGVNVVGDWFRVSPLNITASSFNWSYTTPFNLTPGSYTFSVRATDNLELTTATANRGTLTINVQVPGDAAPNGLLGVTGTLTNVTDLLLPISGTATDDRGVASVRVSIRTATPTGTSSPTAPCRPPMRCSTRRSRLPAPRPRRSRRPSRSPSRATTT